MQEVPEDRWDSRTETQLGTPCSKRRKNLVEKKEQKGGQNGATSTLQEWQPLLVIMRNSLNVFTSLNSRRKVPNFECEVNEWFVNNARRRSLFLLEVTLPTGWKTENDQKRRLGVVESVNSKTSLPKTPFWYPENDFQSNRIEWRC